jgi:hypothetical protein
MTQPTPAQIDALAAVIRQVDGNHSLGAARLAEAILECWIPPVKVVEKPTIGQISDLADAIRSSKAVEDYWINYFGRDSLAAVLSRLDGNDSRGAAALAEEILRHWQPQQPAAKPAPTTERTAIIARLRELVGAVIQGPDTVRREFDMRVPAEPLRDADLVLSTAARMLEADQSEPVAPPPPPSTEKLFHELDQLLDGIDRRVEHPKGGWWETDDGGRFGKIMLRKIKETISRHLRS